MSESTPLETCKRIIIGILAEHGGKMYDETLSSHVQAAYEKVGMQCGARIEEEAIRELRQERRICKSCWDWVLIKSKVEQAADCDGQATLFGSEAR